VGAHVMVVADSAARQREATGAWLDEEIGRGAKIYYKGWFEPSAAGRHWIGGPDGPRRGRDALARGQIELCDFPTVIERCGGTTAGLHRLQADEVARALDEGWPAVAMTQESPGRPMADEAEADEFAAQEGGYDVLAARWPLRVLCQLTTPAENDTAIWRSSAVHHAELRDGRWSARSEDGTWHVSGELDAHVVHRFGGALVGALRAAAASPDGPHLHVDLTRVSFLDVACARMLVLAAASAPSGQRVVVHGVSRLARRAIVAIGRPASLELHGEEGS
jgi:anti-anti-sigma regulatory factor